MNKLTHGQAKKLGMPPGSAIYTGEKRNTPIHITVIDYDVDHLDEREGLSVEDCAGFVDSRSMSWINVDGVHDAAVIQALCESFRVHPLSTEDILSIGTRPKCEEYDDYLFVVGTMLNVHADANGIRIEPEQVSIIVGQRFVLTFQEEPGDAWENIRKRLRVEGSRIRGQGCDYLAYSLLDAVVDHYAVALEHLGAQVESLDDVALEAMNPGVLNTIHQLKRQLLMVRRTLLPLRDVTSVLVRSEIALIQPSTEPYLRDLHDHVIHAIETVEMHRETANSTLELYLAGANNRMNQAMKVLAAMTTIFTPITFISSLYGMNFEYMPELRWPYGYFGVLAVIAMIAVGMFTYLRRQDWL